MPYLTNVGISGLWRLYPYMVSSISLTTVRNSDMNLSLNAKVTMDCRSMYAITIATIMPIVNSQVNMSVNSDIGPIIITQMALQDVNVSAVVVQL